MKDAKKIESTIARVALNFNFSLLLLAKLWQIFRSESVGFGQQRELYLLKGPYFACLRSYKHPVYHPWATKVIVRPPFCLQRRTDQFCSGTREAQSRSPCVLGSIWYHKGITLCSQIARCLTVSFTNILIIDRTFYCNKIALNLVHWNVKAT